MSCSDQTQNANIKYMRRQFCVLQTQKPDIYNNAVKESKNTAQ